MDSLAKDGRYTVPECIKSGLDGLFSAGFADEAEITEAIGTLYKDEHYLMDTHTAVGYKVWKDYAEKTGDTTPVLIAATASPYKFASSIAESIGVPEGKDPFETIEDLSRATGLPVPEGLKGLKGRRIVHKEAIKREDMKQRVKQLLGL